MWIDDRERTAVERDRHGVGRAGAPLVDGTAAALASIQSAVLLRVGNRGVGDDRCRSDARHGGLCTRASFLMGSIDGWLCGRVAARTDEYEKRDRRKGGQRKHKRSAVSVHVAASPKSLTAYVYSIATGFGARAQSRTADLERGGIGRPANAIIGIMLNTIDGSEPGCL
ncbi:MAG TPA: hypothetical protein PL143_18160 [Rhodocyclaceae bacterium]|nr:hypothetical protein [Rhodocyclaceae bacterium]